MIGVAHHCQLALNQCRSGPLHWRGVENSRIGRFNPGAQVSDTGSLGGRPFGVSPPKSQKIVVPVALMPDTYVFVGRLAQTAKKRSDDLSLAE